METYLASLQSQSNMYPSDQLQLLPGGNSERYPLINFGGNNQMLGESLPNEEQLCNFLSSLDSSTSLTFEKLLQSSNQDNGYWCNNYDFNSTQLPTYDFPVPENSTGLFTTPSRPRIIRGCQDQSVDRWNANLPDRPLYAPASPSTDLNNNIMACPDKNYSNSNFTPKKYECTEKQCQGFLFNQYFPAKDICYDRNNNVADVNNNACAVSDKSDVTYELNVVSFLFHTRALQTLAGKFHVQLGLSLDQLNLLTRERQEIEKSIFADDVTSTSLDLKLDQLTRIERLVSGHLNEIKPVKKIVAKSEVVCGESVMAENRQLVDSWIECIEKVKFLRQNCSYLSQNEYVSQQIVNLKMLCSQTRSVRTCLWCVHTLVTDKVA